MAIQEIEKTRENPGGARWCEEHRRHECVKNRHHGRGPCHAPAIRGTSVCRIHAGVSKSVIKAKGEAQITAWKAMEGTPDIDYRIAVLSVLQMTWLRLNAYSDLLRQQVAIDGAEMIDGVEVLDGGNPEPSGLIGYRYGAAGKDGRVYVQSEEVRALVVLEATERDRTVKYAETAHKMGISDRLTSLAEKWGDVVAGRVTGLLGELNLTPEQAELVPGLVQRYLGSIDMGVSESVGRNNQ